MIRFRKIFSSGLVGKPLTKPLLKERQPKELPFGELQKVECGMFKRNRSEMVLTKPKMFVICFAQRILEFVWQGKKINIIQSTILTREEQENDLLECTFSATLNHDGTSIEVKVGFDLTHDYFETSNSNPWGWTPVNHIDFAICSIRTLKAMKVSFDVHATWKPDPEVICETVSMGALNYIRVALGLTPFPTAVE